MAFNLNVVPKYNFRTILRTLNQKLSTVGRIVSTVGR